MKPAAPPRRARLQTSVSGALHKRLTELRLAQGVTERALVEAALREYLDGTNPARLASRRLHRIALMLGRLQRDVGLLLESFGSFVRVWFAHTPEVAEDHKRAAWAQSKRRYDDFVGHVSAVLQSRKGFADRLAQELAADDEELAALRDGESPEGATP